MLSEHWTHSTSEGESPLHLIRISGPLCRADSSSLKQMGLVTTSSSRSFHRVPPRRPAKALRKRKSAASSPWLSSTTIGGVALVGLGAVLVGLVMTSIKSSPAS